MNIDKELIRHWACLCESRDGEGLDEDVDVMYAPDNDTGVFRRYKTLTDRSNANKIAKYHTRTVLADIAYSCGSFLDEFGSDGCRETEFVFDLMIGDMEGDRRVNVGTVSVSNPKALPVDDIYWKLVYVGDYICDGEFIPDNGDTPSNVKRCVEHICSAFKNGYKVVSARSNPIELKPGKYMVFSTGCWHAGRTGNQCTEGIQAESEMQAI